MNLEHCSIQQALPACTEPPVEKQRVQRRVLVTYLNINKKVVLQTTGSSLCQAICHSQPALRVKDLAENKTVSLRDSIIQCQVCIKPILGLLGMPAWFCCRKSCGVRMSCFIWHLVPKDSSAGIQPTHDGITC